MNKSSVAGKILPRHAERAVRSALQFSRIVVLVGPRQSGKTTLARLIAGEGDRRFVTMDDRQQREFARADPAGFVALNDTGVIDEIQKVPDLILEIKRKVDDDPRPGRYLISGSVDMFKSSLVSDSLAGRVVAVELLPLSQAEIGRSGPSPLIDDAFAGNLPGLAEAGRTDALLPRLLTGGYPLAWSIGNDGFRQQWLRSYADEIASKDLPEMFRIHRRSVLAELLAVLAGLSGRLVNVAQLGSRLGIDGKSADRLLHLLELMFIVRRIPAWHGSRLRQAGRTARMHFLDPGLLAAVAGIDEQSVAIDRGRLGAVAECLVHSEIAKSAAAAGDRITISHYRDRNGNEVDFVLARASGEIVGLEVKLAASVSRRDFRGLRYLADAAGEKFACGIVLHDGSRIERVGDRLFAMPFKALWQDWRTWRQPA